MTSDNELFKKYGQELKDTEFRLEALSYNKGWVYIVVIYTESAIERVEVNKKTFKKLSRRLNNERFILPR